METSESIFVSLTVEEDVIFVGSSKLFHLVVSNIFKTSRSSSFISGVVGVASRAIPISLDGFAVKVNVDSEFFSESEEDVSGQPQMVSSFDSLGNTNLEFPLSGSDLSVESRNLESGIQAASDVSFSDGSAKIVEVTN